MKHEKHILKGYLGGQDMLQPFKVFGDRLFLGGLIPNPPEICYIEIELGKGARKNKKYEPHILLLTDPPARDQILFLWFQMQKGVYNESL